VDSYQSALKVLSTNRRHSVHRDWSLKTKVYTKMFKELGFLILTLLFYTRAARGLKTIHAANFNGKTHTDSLGITYEAVTLKSAAQYSETYPNVPKADYSLYQTIAYDRKLNYTIPVDGWDHYLLIVKFVAWNSYSASFKMTLNSQHSVPSNFTSYDSTGKYNVVYDHYIFFSVCDDYLQYKNERSVIKNNKIQISIWSPAGFYTSMSAVAVLKGEVDQVPVLPTAEIYSYADLRQTLGHVCYEAMTTTTTYEPTTTSSTTEWPSTTTEHPEPSTTRTPESTTTSVDDYLQTVHAVNFNGYNHVDSLGISYDSLNYGSAANYSSRIYKFVPYADQSLYQTVYYDRAMNYSIPVNGSGKYLLLIKFLNFDSWSAVFNMTLNGQHTVRSNFTLNTSARDIAYDHYVYFSVCDNLLLYKKETSRIRNGHIDIRMWSPDGWITSISALALLKGDVDVVPVLPTAEIYRESDRDELSEHYCDEGTDPTPTAPWTTTTTPEITSSTTWPPTSTSTPSRPPTTTGTTPRPPTTPSPTPPKPPMPPKPAPGQVHVVNIFNTFINSIVKNYNFNYIVHKTNRTARLPDEVFNIGEPDSMVLE
jgi:Malectin domain